MAFIIFTLLSMFPNDIRDEISFSKDFITNFTQIFHFVIIY